MADSFKFELVAPDELLLSEEAQTVVVPGSDGDFTVMSKHAPFMTVLRPGIVTVELAGGSTKQLFVRGGFADVNDDGLTILAEHADPVEAVDLSELDVHITDLRKRMERDHSSDDHSRSKLEQYIDQLSHARAQLPG